LCALREELARCCAKATRAQDSRDIYRHSKQKRRIQQQIDELEARRKDELIGGWE